MEKRFKIRLHLRICSIICTLVWLSPGIDILNKRIGIKEGTFSFFPELKIMIFGKKRRIRVDIDRAEEFIAFVLKTRYKNSEVKIDEKQKTINFSPNKKRGADGV